MHPRAEQYRHWAFAAQQRATEARDSKIKAAYEQVASGWFALAAGPQRPDCVAGVGGLELRNVDANYLFERSHRFAGIQQNSGFGDYSRLSCGAGDTQLGRS